MDTNNHVLNARPQMIEGVVGAVVEEPMRRIGSGACAGGERSASGFQTPLELSANALRVLRRRYLKRNAEGEILERPEDMFARVARAIAEADRLYRPQADVEEVAAGFYEMMARLEFLPNSPTLMNAGRELGQLSACFVLPVEDSMESIFETVKNTALIHKSGGGTGFSFSRIRPKNDMVLSTKGVSSGPVSFMRVFDAATETIKQGGTRRGANMGILRVDHPDILEFIACKSEQHLFNNFNISVAVTEKFMQAVEEDGEYELINPRTGQATGKLRAREVFQRIVHLAWKNGEPGIIFLDRLNKDNPTPALGEIESTNPCGEQPLLPYESCNLGSINLARMAKGNSLDWEKLRRTVRQAVHFLDNVIDVNRYPLPQIEKMTKGNRKIGLGVMGYADLLLQLGLPYNSEAALKKAEEIMSFVQQQAREASADLARERGPFPNYPQSTWAQAGGRPLRNATTTTIAPTGTISIIAGASSGIEPLYAVCFVRRVMDRDELVEVNPYFERMAREQGFWSEALMKKIAESGSLARLPEVPENLRRLFVTAHDITPEWHVRTQAAFQKYTDNAVSKTVNLPHQATEEDVAEVYRLANILGCKGVTVYRDGSREEQVLSTPTSSGPAPRSATPSLIKPRQRPDIVHGYTQKMTTGCGALYVTINEDDEGIFELFTAMGKAGGCAASQAEAISRLISLALRAGIDPEEIIKQLAGVRCPSPVWKEGRMILSCADALAQAIKRHLELARERKSKTPPTTPPPQPENKPVAAPQDGAAPSQFKEIKVCPDCGGAIEYSEGCLLCRSCGFSRCA